MLGHLSIRKQKFALTLLILVWFELTDCFIEKLFLNSQQLQLHSFNKKLKEKLQENQSVYNLIEKARGA